MRFIDCNASIGEMPMLYSPLVNPTLENQLSLMTRYGISYALCSSGFCINGDINYGNGLISSWAEKNSGILPVFTALPENFTPFNFARAVRIYPKDMLFPLSSLHVGDICTAAEKGELPILLSFSQTDIRELLSLLSDFPGNNFILTEVYYRNIRALCPLLENFGNLYIETSYLKTFGALEFLCGRFGAGRFLFGTGSPYYDAGSAIVMLLGAEISQDEKEMIAHGNIESLCKMEASGHDG